MADIMVQQFQGSHFLVSQILIIVLFFQFSCHAMGETERNSSEQMLSVINIGVIRDVSSPFGTMINLCIEMAFSDFYSAHPKYMMRLEPRPRDVQHVLDIDLAVLELLEHEQVLGILEPQGSIDEIFVAELGRRAQVPIISFAAGGSGLSDTENQYFVRTSVDGEVQAKALAAICQGFKWKEAVVLYEDLEFGYRFLSHLSNTFLDVDIKLAYLTAIPASANETRLLEELKVLKYNQTVKVYLVHMNASLGFRLFTVAKQVGMMSEGHAWIVTDSISNFLNSKDRATLDLLEGVVGIRPYIPLSKNLENFRTRWKRKSTILKRNNGPIMDLNIYGLWAYDTVTALAIAVEKIGPVNRSSLFQKSKKKSNLRISSVGPQLMEILSSTRFRGLSGDFQLVYGKLKPSAIEVFNVNRTGEKRLGFWTPDRGLIGELLSSSGEHNYSTSIRELKKVVWPGGSETQPVGWSIPPTGPLRVGVPCISGQTEFVNPAIIDHVTNEIAVKGFAIDIFVAATNSLPFELNYVFYCFLRTNNTNWTYDDMLHGIPEKYDMVVADTTISAQRASYVTFSLPYYNSGIVLVVKKKAFDMWTFTRPFGWNLWLAILLSFIFMGIVIWSLERRMTNPAPAEESFMTNMPAGMTYLAPVAVLAFQERNMVSNKWSFLVLVCWLFMAFILMQSYTANLSAILTIDRLTFSVSDDYILGYREGSIVKRFFIEDLKIDEFRLRSYSSLEEFHDAMRKGSKNGGIDAIIDEIPYMTLLVNRYKPKYKIVGPTYRADGLGFAFPLGSPLAASFSRAILNVTQNETITFVEKKYFGRHYSFFAPMPQGTSSLSFDDFAGLFSIVASAAVVAVICSETSILSILRNNTCQYFNKCFTLVNTKTIDGDSTNCEEVTSSSSLEAGREEEHNGEQEPRQDRDDDQEIVESAMNNEVGREIIDHLPRNL